jgi:hypothetical protein
MTARVARPAARVEAGVGRLVVRPLLFLAAARLGAGLVGQWVTAAVAGALLLGWGLSRWQRLERWLDARERRLVAVDAYLARYVAKSSGPGQDEAGEHVAFARALAAVSARYLDLCEDQADTHATSREAWR